MLLGDAKVRDEHGLDIEKAEHRVLDGERMHRGGDGKSSRSTD